MATGKDAESLQQAGAAKRYRVNRGGGHIRAVGLMIEGTRTNLLAENPFAAYEGITFKGEQFVDKPPCIEMWVCELLTDSAFRIEMRASCPRRRLGYVFSAFVGTSGQNVLAIRASISDGIERKCENLLVTDRTVRFEFAHEFATSPEHLTVELTGHSPGTGKAETASLLIGLVMLEEGLFASSPFRHGPGPNGDTRAGAAIAFPTKEILSSPVATLTFFFVPLWSGAQIESDARAYVFDCLAEDRSNAISVFADGENDGRLTIEAIADGEPYKCTSDVVPIRGNLYSIAIRTTSEIIELLVNGYAVGALRLRLPRHEQLGEQAFFASTGRDFVSAGFGVLTYLECYSEWLSDEILQGLLFRKRPHDYPQFEPQWLHENRTMPLKVFNQGLAADLAVFLLDMPARWQESQPEWLKGDQVLETHCRDEIHRALQYREFDPIREYVTDDGRTDLLVRQGKKFQSAAQVRLEFKVWGRHDYTDVPKKPLKYFTEVEDAGIVVMINPNKGRIGDQYRANVSALNDPTAVSVADRPLQRRSAPDHFVSFHRNDPLGKVVEVLHIIFNRFGPFTDQG